MTEEEARAEAIEEEQLLKEIDQLQNYIERAIVENQNLQVELETLVQNIEILIENAGAMDIEVNKSMDYIKNHLTKADVSTVELFALIDELTSSYFIFKNLSSASKNVTQYTDEYYKKFKFFNELRRISLGYVVGLDAHICSDKTMRKKVEGVYLQNTEYWLAYAIMSVMLWASDDAEAAKRAMLKALSMDYFSSSLFYLLINLRFTRVDSAKKWYLYYLNRIDLEKLGNEWQYLLQAYLSGVFGVDKEFNRLVHECFSNMLEQMTRMHPNYGNKVEDRTLEFMNAYIHVTSNEFETLRRSCIEYNELKALLSTAEKNEILAVYFRGVLESDSKIEPNMFQRIENILYDLINAYDRAELKVIKNKRYNEMIIKAKGDLEQAQQFYNLEFPNEVTAYSLENLLFNWAFEEDTSQVDITVKKFAVSYLKKWISKGFSAFGDSYRKIEKKKYNISIDGWQGECSEDSYFEAKTELEKFYNKNRIFDTIKDKYVAVFIGMVIAAIVVLGVTVVFFNQIALVMGILLGVVGGFLLWRRVSDMQSILQAKREHGCQVLKKALDELRTWRDMYKQEDAKNEALVNVFENIEL